MKHSTPCPQWADKLIASHARALSPSDYLLLKEHLLTCPQCMTAHSCYLSVEAQIRNMPVLQPQRQLSAKMLLETEAQQKKVWLPDAARWTEIARKRTGIILVAYSARLKNLVIALRRPGYALTVLLFCLLTTVAAIGTISYAPHSTLQETQPPHLVASTTGITLHIVTDLSYHVSPPQNQMVPLLANATLTLRNTGGQPLQWNFNRNRSTVFAVYEAAMGVAMISTQPSHGILKSHEYSSVLIIASGISYEQLSFNETDAFARIVFTSNGGDVSLQASLKKPTTVTPEASSIPPLFFSGGSNPIPLSMRPDYLLRRQDL